MILCHFEMTQLYMYVRMRNKVIVIAMIYNLCMGFCFWSYKARNGYYHPNKRAVINHITLILNNRSTNLK